jgi:hypothetical protein
LVRPGETAEDPEGQKRRSVILPRDGLETHLSGESRLDAIPEHGRQSVDFVIRNHIGKATKCLSNASISALLIAGSLYPVQDDTTMGVRKARDISKELFSLSLGLAGQLRLELKAPRLRCPRIHECGHIGFLDVPDIERAYHALKKTVHLQMSKTAGPAGAGLSQSCLPASR